MVEYKEAQKKRKSRQLIMSAIFIAILAAGWHWPLLGFFVPFCVLIGVGIGIFRGRKWCDWLCPRGSLFDAVIKPLSPAREIPRIFKPNKFKITFLALITLILTSNIISRWPNPQKIGKFFILMLSVTTVLGIVLGLIFHQRSWCFFCPAGSLAGWVSRKRHNLKIITELCNECGLCAQTCPMQLAQNAQEDACIKCDLCVKICPKQALLRQGNE